MKIILCIFLLNITVSVFGQSVELNGILGKSIEFPAAVKKGGYLMYGGDPIGESSLGTPGIGKYSGRVQWDICTGLFSLSGLKMEDIGEYKVQNTDQNIAVFQLNLYKDNVNVSKPHVSITQNEYPCTIVCTAERGTGVTLSWYREGQKKPYSTSSVRSAPHLDLPQTVERSGTYTCEAKNSVSNEKASITVGDHCTVTDNSSTIVASVIAAVVVLIAVAFAVLCYYIIRRRQAVRTLRRVKKLLNNVDLHAYDETDPPNAVRLFIQVKEKLDNLDPHACGVSTLLRGVSTLLRVERTLRQVQMLLDIVDLHDYDETVPPDALRTLIQVKMILDNVYPHKYGDAVQPVPQSGFKRKRRDYIISNSPSSDRMCFPIGHLGEKRLVLPPDGVSTLLRVKKLLNNVDLHPSGETSLELSPDGETSLELSPDALRTLIQVKMLLDKVDLHAYD